MKYGEQIKKQASALRRAGKSTYEIAEMLGVSATSARRWVSFVELSEQQQKSLRMVPFIRATEICLQCSESLQGKSKRNRFCNHSCAATYNNSGRLKGVSECPACGGRKMTKSELCGPCRNVHRRQTRMSTPISEFFSGCGKYASRKFVNIRMYARKELELSGRPKECEVCGFDIVVQACHIKGLAEFDASSLMGVVNSLSNLKWLCPNHHAMLDKGIDIE